MKPPGQEYQQRRPSEELICLTPDLRRELQPVHRLAGELAATRLAAARQRRSGLAPAEQRQHLCTEWAKLLGTISPAPAKVVRNERQKAGPMMVERLALESGEGLVVPVVLLLPAQAVDRRLPVVVAFAQEGKQGFLVKRPEMLARLLEAGVAVCLPDVRGCGETSPQDGSRGRGGSSTSVSATELMLGETMLGRRLGDLRTVLAYLRGRSDIDAGRMALWGDSFAARNARDRSLAVPLDADKQPTQAEPLGGLLALFASLFEETICATFIQGGLVSFQSMLNEPFCYVPHDAVVPGALSVSDLSDMAAALAPKQLRLTNFVDAQNRAVSEQELRQAYRNPQNGQKFTIAEAVSDAVASADWLISELKK
jgi:hypothetical protein